MLFRRWLQDQQLITDSDYAALEKKIEERVQQAVDFAEKGSWEPIEQLEKYVYSERRME
jgi:TPP-dependent pyruvate/acetoin dehydrogenase alpha subunit